MVLGNRAVEEGEALSFALKGTTVAVQRLG